jgi:hypothetical protein
MAEHNHNVFRDGKVFLCARECDTCVFRSGNVMSLQPGRLKGMIEEGKERGAGIVCYSTLPASGEEDQALCRGFFDRYKDDAYLLQLAERLGIIEEVDPPTKEEHHEQATEEPGPERS